MRANAYLKDDEANNQEVLELHSYFQDEINFDIHNTQIKFASRDQIDDLKTLLIKRLKEQKAKLQSWLNQDKSMNFDLFFDFTQPSSRQDSWDLLKVYDCTNFIERNSLLNSVVGEEQWVVQNFNDIPSLTGCNVTQRIAKVVKPINIRSRAFTLNISFTLCGESCFNIITRSKQNNEETTIIKFAKTGKGSSQRLFLLFGVLGSTKKEIVYTKKTEIPVLTLKQHHIDKNYLDISCCVHDNGDQFLVVSGEVNQATNQYFKARYEQIVPYFEEFFIYMFAEKDNAVIKKLRLKLGDRENFTESKDKSRMTQRCCQIF